MKWLGSFIKARRRRRKLDRLIKSLGRLHSQADLEKFRDIAYFFEGKSLSTWDEQAGLFQVAKESPENAVIVEVGSWIGHGTCLLAAGARGPSPRVYAVDAFCCLTAEADEKKLYDKFLQKVDPTLSQRELFDRHIARFHLQDRVTAVPFPSEEAIPHLPLKPGSVDLLFLDGGHTLEVVRKDIELYVPLVKPGGLVAFHDFGSGRDGVTTAVWEEVLRGTFPVYVRKTDSLLVLKKG